MGLLNSFFGVKPQSSSFSSAQDHSFDSARYHSSLDYNQSQLQQQMAQYQMEAYAHQQQMAAAYNFSRSSYPNTKLGDALRYVERPVDQIKTCLTEEEIAWALLEGFQQLSGDYYVKYQTEATNV